MKYRELRGWKYELLETETLNINTVIGHDIETEYINYYFATGRLFVEPRYAWDGASGPTWDDKTNMRASLIHDALYQLIREGHLDIKWRKRADELLRDIFIEDAISQIRIKATIGRLLLVKAIKLRANLWYWSVRIAGRKYAMPEKNPRGKVIEIIYTDFKHKPLIQKGKHND